MSSDPRQPIDYEPADPASTPPGLLAGIRYALVLTSLAMIVMAALTAAGRMPFPRWVSVMFLAVAASDLLIGWTVFSGRKRRTYKS